MDFTTILLGLSILGNVLLFSELMTTRWKLKRKQGTIDGIDRAIKTVAKEASKPARILRGE